MRFVKPLALALALVLGAGAVAYAAAYGAEYTYISKVNVAQDNYLYLAVPGNFSYDHGCSKPWYVRSQHPLTDARTKAQMQVALSSFVAKKQVHVWTDGCTSYGYPIMTKLQMQQD